MVGALGSITAILYNWLKELCCQCFPFFDLADLWQLGGKEWTEPGLHTLDSLDGVDQLCGVVDRGVEVIRVAAQFWTNEDTTRYLRDDIDQFGINKDRGPIRIAGYFIFDRPLNLLLDDGA